MLPGTSAVPVPTSSTFFCQLCSHLGQVHVWDQPLESFSRTAPLLRSVSWKDPDTPQTLPKHSRVRLGCVWGVSLPSTRQSSRGSRTTSDGSTSTAATSS